MRKLLIVFLISVFTFYSADAQVDRSQPPEPGPAPVIQIGDFESFEMDNGMTVIVVENRQVPVVSFQLSLDIDPVLEGEAKGYVSLAGSLLREGTTNRTKKEIDETIDFIGASLSTSSSGIFASSLTRHRETLLELMSDILMNPSFPEEELERLMNQTRSGLATTRNDAGSMVANVSRAVVYGEDHPYGEVTTEESLDNVQRDMLRQYYEDHFKPNVAYMVIVGDISLDEAREVTETYFGSWEPGEVPTRTYPTPAPPDGRRVALADRRGAVQSLVTVTHPVELQPGHEDAIKANVMNSILGGGAFSGRLMQNLREDKGYTYGARSNLSSDRLVGRFNARAEVRNAVTDSTVTEILYEMERMMQEPVEESNLELTRNFMTGSFARSLESPRTIANFALNTIRYDLPDDYYRTYLERLNEVSVEDVHEMANKYLNPDNAYIVVAGSREEVMESLRPFSATGMVELYDAFGRPVEEEELRPVPEGYTAETVIEQYIEAIGGRERLENIRDIRQEMTGRLMGQEVQMTIYKKDPHFLLQKTSMGGMTLSQQLFDGEKGVVVSQMGRQEFTEGAEFEQFKMESAIIPELTYKNLGIEKELLGIEIIEGQASFKVKDTYPGGNTALNYYCTASGLKVKTESNGGISIYDEYKEVDGFVIPFSITQEVGPQTIEVTIDKVEINTGMDETIFVVD